MAAPRQVSPEEVMAARAVAQSSEQISQEIAVGRVGEDERRAKRVEAVALRLAGFSYEQIGTKLELSPNGARTLIENTLERAENVSVTEMRELENQRLDRAQAAIWSSVIAGDVKALNAFLRISQQRSKINGLYAPTKIDLSIGVRHEMEQALSSLEELVTSQAQDIVDAEIIDDPHQMELPDADQRAS